MDTQLTSAPTANALYQHLKTVLPASVTSPTCKQIHLTIPLSRKIDSPPNGKSTPPYPAVQQQRIVSFANGNPNTKYFYL